MVKLAATFVFAAALAVATVRAQEAGSETVEEVLSRDVSSAESDLFGRAAAKVMNDMFSREELSEVYGRDFDGDLTWRDVTELVEREAIDMSEIEELAGRAAAPQQAPDAPEGDAPAETKPKPKHQSVFGQVLSFFNRLIHPKPKPGAADAKGKGKEAHSKAAHPTPKKHEKPAAKEEKPAKEDAPAPAEGAAAEGAEEARDFLDSVLEEPVERDFLSDDEALEVRELLDNAELELEARELLDNAELELETRGLLEDAEFELEAREVLDNAQFELEVRELLENAELELAERSFEDEDLLEARELLEEYSDILEREVDEDVFERDFEEELLERDAEEDLFEREIGDELDDELLRRAFEIVEELEMLD